MNGVNPYAVVSVNPLRQFLSSEWNAPSLTAHVSQVPSISSRPGRNGRDRERRIACTYPRQPIVRNFGMTRRWRGDKRSGRCSRGRMQGVWLMFSLTQAGFRMLDIEARSESLMAARELDRCRGRHDPGTWTFSF